MDAAYEELFRSSYAPLVRALAVAAGDEQIAADAVQDAFVQALRGWRRIGSYDRPEAWVRRVALNRITDEARRRRRRADHVARQSTTSRDVVAADREPEVDLAQAIATLPDGQPLAVCLYYLADLPVAEVAAALEVSPGTVKSQLHDARAALAGRPEVIEDG